MEGELKVSFLEDLLENRSQVLASRILEFSRTEGW